MAGDLVPEGWDLWQSWRFPERRAPLCSRTMDSVNPSVRCSPGRVRWVERPLGADPDLSQMPRKEGWGRGLVRFCPTGQRSWSENCQAPPYSPPENLILEKRGFNLRNCISHKPLDSFPLTPCRKPLCLIPPLPPISFQSVDIVLLLLIPSSCYHGALDNQDHVLRSFSVLGALPRPDSAQRKDWSIRSLVKLMGHRNKFQIFLHSPWRVSSQMRERIWWPQWTTARRLFMKDRESQAESRKSSSGGRFDMIDAIQRRGFLGLEELYGS